MIQYTLRPWLFSSFSHSSAPRPRDHRRLPGLGRASLGGPGAGRAGLAAADPAAGRTGDGRGVAARVLPGRKNQGKTRGKMVETLEKIGKIGKIGKTIGKLRETLGNPGELVILILV